MEKTTGAKNKTLKEAKMSEEAPMYIYATEMVSEYCSILDIEGKKILSITGSGDQIINPILMGAKEVVGFDVNKRAEFITHLKIAAIKSLSYEEFLDFFGSKSTKPSFDYEIYKKIEKELPDTIKRFFTKIFAEF